MSAPTLLATCLGCGCVCDDIRLTIKDGRITKSAEACELGAAWFGDGRVPDGILAGGATVSINEALDRATALLSGARAPLVYLGGDLPVEAYRGATAIADRLRARLDSAASDTVSGGVQAQQVRGRAAATLGELLNRADVLLFWGVDPDARYPRFGSRYAIEPKGLATSGGRKGRTVIAVDVGASKGPADADLRVTFEAEDEATALGMLRAAVAGRGAPVRPELKETAERLTKAKYAAIVYDAEPSSLPANPFRVERLIGLTHALNGPTRAALTGLRGGANRNGVEALCTWQTGFPFAVDFSRGFPPYRPDEPASRLLASGAIDVVLLAGSAATLPPEVRSALPPLRVIANGPGVSQSKPGAQVAIDTGKGGIHEAGTAYRMDDVPLPLTVTIPGVRGAGETLTALYTRLLRAGGAR